MFFTCSSTFFFRVQFAAAASGAPAARLLMLFGQDVSNGLPTFILLGGDVSDGLLTSMLLGGDVSDDLPTFMLLGGEPRQPEHFFLRVHYVFKTFSSCFQAVFKTFPGRFQDVSKTFCK